ncbi:MAG TPA: abortive infection family protein [bacterium]|jgi:hypothetical protein
MEAIELQSGKKERDRLVLAIVRCIHATFSQSEWDELAYITHGQKIIYEHPRLFRSMFFGDEDYKSCIFDVVEGLIKADAQVVDAMLDFIKLRDWLKENYPSEASYLFGDPDLIFEPLEKVAIRNSHDVTHHLRRIREAVDSDPEQAIGSAKELVESVLKVIIEGSGEKPGGDDFPQLLRRVQKMLDLDPSAITVNAKGADTVRRVLSNLGQVAIGIDELRNLYGTGHGRTKRSGVSVRHARLVVGSAATLVTFLMETYEAKI